MGVWGLGWHVLCDGMELTQFTYFQQMAGFDCRPVAGEEFARRIGTAQSPVLVRVAGMDSSVGWEAAVRLAERCACGCGWWRLSAGRTAQFARHIVHAVGERQPARLGHEQAEGDRLSVAVGALLVVGLGKRSLTPQAAQKRTVRFPPEIRLVVRRAGAPARWPAPRSCPSACGHAASKLPVRAPASPLPSSGRGLAIWHAGAVPPSSRAPSSGSRP